MFMTFNPKFRQAILVILLALGAIVVLFPLFWMVSTAFKAENEVFATPMRWLPDRLHVENFTIPFYQKPIVRWFINSILVAAVVMAGNLFISSLAGYGFAKFKFPGHRAFFLIVLATFMVPLQVTMVPLFLVVKALGWIDSYGGLIVPLMADAFGIFLMRQYINDIPDDYLNQARIDGAMELRIWWSIIVPMSLPILSGLGILTFLGNFDELLWPLILITSENLRTIPLGLASFENTYQTIHNQLMAVSLIAMLPVLTVFIVFQRRIIVGMTLTGLKQ